MATSSSLTSAAPVSSLKFSGKCYTQRPDSVRLRPSQICAAHASVERPGSSTSAASLYDVLGIQTSATCQEIKQAYRRLARVSHPDAASSGADDDFIRIHSAYATLSDPEKRADYDSTMFMRRRPVSSFGLSAASYGYSTAAMPVYSNKRWETDQCW
uniref:J domain-containing protein n=1 Tax=Kalanchoe fedtschenkoi TaxID=63787 RepID=A0A7N0T098_KALFE